MFSCDFTHICCNTTLKGVCVDKCPSIGIETEIAVRRELANNDTEVEVQETGNTTEIDTVTEEDSNSTEQTEAPADMFTLLTYGGLFQLEGFATLPSDAIKVGNYSNSEQVCTADTCFPNDSVSDSWASLSGVNYGYGHAFYALDSLPILLRCIPTSSAISYASSETGFTLPDDALGGEEFSFFEKLYSDLWKCVDWILGIGGLGGVILGFFYLIILRIPGIAKMMVWGSILITDAMFFGAGYYGLTLAEEWETADPQVNDDSDIKVTKIISYVLFAIGGLFLCLIIFIRKELKLATASVKEASKAISRMPLLITFPAFEAAIIIGFLALWMVYAVFLAGVGEPSTFTIENPINSVETTVRTFSYTDEVKGAAIFLLFCLFWTYQFIIALGQIIISMAVAKWYFSRDKSLVGSSTVIKAICASMAHIGTAAFGSLVIAIVKMIRAVLTYVQKKLKDSGDSQLAKAIVCSCSCCMCCLDKFLQFINKNAYIQTAIFGTGFYTSSVEAFYLIARNAMKVTAITYVSTAVSMVGRIFISVTAGGTAYFLLGKYMVDEVHGLAGPTVVTLILGYFIADVFMDIFDMTVITILHCFIADDEMFTEDEAYAGGDLRTLIDDWDTSKSIVVQGE